MGRRANIDPQELQRFARALGSFNIDLREKTRLIHGQFKQLSEQTWRDQEQQKFAHEFERTLLQLEAFMKLVDEHVPYLLRKAQRAQDYIDQV